jgi:hypothetical protein
MENYMACHGHGTRDLKLSTHKFTTKDKAQWKGFGSNRLPILAGEIKTALRHGSRHAAGNVVPRNEAWR